MTAPNISVLIPVLIAVLIVSAVVVCTCLYCYRPERCLGWRSSSNTDYSSDEEKYDPPARPGHIVSIEHENVGEHYPQRPTATHVPGHLNVEHVHIHHAEPEAEIVDIVDADPE